VRPGGYARSGPDLGGEPHGTRQYVQGPPLAGRLAPPLTHVAAVPLGRRA